MDNGLYSIDFTVLKDGTDETSVMDDYTEKPAHVYVNDGTFTFDLTLTNNSWYQEILINGEEPEIVDEDEAEDTRVVRFSNDSLQPVDAWVHIIVTGIPGFTYDNEYDVQIAFDEDSLTFIEADQEPPAPTI
ncbi:cell surface protein IsdA, transfers heme from hemoglobin to apo-IsdC [Geomicrobium sp. JCM 19039]|nr:cell surface protein IsdA, transfers heme from hemoglobin to apo-IsdC [Geomicrobium sp. JCM 19039]